MKHGNTRVESSSAARSFRPDDRGLRSRSEERTNERASGRPYELALDVRADEQFFFFYIKIRTALYTNTALPRVGVERPNGPYVART